MMFGRRFEVHADGVLIGKYRTYKQALAVTEGLLDNADRYFVSERINGRLVNRAFGYRSGTTTTDDLVAMGVPINSASLNRHL
jgi:hypothetical protein